MYAMPKIDMRGNISYIYELRELKLYARWTCFQKVYGVIIDKSKIIP